MTHFLKDNISSERMGNWNLHFNAVKLNIKELEGKVDLEKFKEFTEEGYIFRRSINITRVFLLIKQLSEL